MENFISRCGQPPEKRVLVDTNQGSPSGVQGTLSKGLSTKRSFRENWQAAALCRREIELVPCPAAGNRVWTVPNPNLTRSS